MNSFLFMVHSNFTAREINDKGPRFAKNPRTHEAESMKKIGKETYR